MKIKFVGTGGAFDTDLGTAAAIVEHGGTKVLIDCGFTTLPRLVELNLIKDIDYVLITHMHGDHIGSFPTFLACAEVKIGKRIPIIVPSEDFKTEIHNLLTVTFEADRADYLPIADFPWIGFIDTFNLHVPNNQSYAYYFTDANDLIFYSGDLGDITVTTKFLKSHTKSSITVFQDINWKEVKSHVHYKIAQEALKDYEAYGYHCSKATKPEDCTIKLVEDFPEFHY